MTGAWRNQRMTGPRAVSSAIRGFTAQSMTVVKRVSRKFSISPALGLQTTWDLDNDGPLRLPSSGAWIIRPMATFVARAKTWGAGGGENRPAAPGGAGGAFDGFVVFLAGVDYRLSVGGAGSVGAGGAGFNGGGTGSTGGGTDPGGGGGGYTGIATLAGMVLAISGGGGGGARASAAKGGGGGGAIGQDGGDVSVTGGDGGTQTAGGAAGTGGASGQAGSYLQGGNGTSHVDQGSGGGGGGYYGGGSGAALASTDAGGGGGGSGYMNPNMALVFNATLFSAVQNVPGNATDSDRGTAGDSNFPGKIILL